MIPTTPPAFLSTLSLRRATNNKYTQEGCQQFLSTLSLRRATRHWQTGQSRTRQFLSTLSLRRATLLLCPFSPFRRYFYPRSPCGERPLHIGRGCGMIHNFYPRSPCGERHNINSSVNTADKISIHALLAESDMLLRDSTGRSVISIHALLAESDDPVQCADHIRHDFYPRSPCGERLGLDGRFKL